MHSLPSLSNSPEKRIHGIPEQDLLIMEKRYKGILAVALNPKPEIGNKAKQALLQIYLKLKKAYVQKDHLDAKANGALPSYPTNSDLPDDLHEIVFPGSLERRDDEATKKATQKEVIIAAYDIDRKQKGGWVTDSLNLTEFFDQVEADLDSSRKKTSAEVEAVLEKNGHLAIAGLKELTLEQFFGALEMQVGSERIVLPEVNKTVNKKIQLLGREMDVVGNNNPNGGTEIVLTHVDRENQTVGINMVATKQTGKENYILAKQAAAIEEIYLGEMQRGSRDSSAMMEYAKVYLEAVQKNKSLNEKAEFSMRSSVIDLANKKIHSSSLGDFMCIIYNPKSRKIQKMAGRQSFVSKKRQVSELDSDVVVKADFPLAKIESTILEERLIAAGGKDKAASVSSESLDFQDEDVVILASPKLFATLVNVNDLAPGKNAEAVFKQKLEEELAGLKAEQNVAEHLQVLIQKKMGSIQQPYNLVVLNPA